MRNTLAPHRAGDVIDAEFTVIEEPQKQVSFAGLALCFVAMFFAGGAALGVWSGDAAMGGLALLAAVATCVVFVAKSKRRIGGLYRAFMLVGLVGIGLVALAPVGWLCFVGGLLCGLSVLILRAFDKKGLRYVR